MRGFLKINSRNSYPYGHLVIDLKSDTSEKDRLHIDLFCTAKTIEEKMAVDKGSIGTKCEEDENEKEERGGLRKRRRSEEEEEMEEEEAEKEETSVMRSPGRRECQKFKEHTICLANCPDKNGCF